jgi:hypothetical protein
MRYLADLRPVQATVLDLEAEAQFDEVLNWAEEASQYVQRVVIVPKVFGVIPRIPERVNGADVILGYSVPTKYAGTEVPVWEFGRRPVHLLGGSPKRQMALRHYLNVVSADGNYVSKMAVKYCQFWVPGTARKYARNKYWPTLREANGGEEWVGDEDAYIEAFRRSCVNVMKAWETA